jgi:hypothetical protein
MTDEPERAAPRPRIPWPIAAVVAALGLTVVVILLIGRHRPPPAKTWDHPLDAVAISKSVSGSVRVIRGAERRTLATGDTIYAGEGIETGHGASLSMTTHPVDARVLLGGDTSLVFETAAETRVQAGTVKATLGTAPAQFVTPHGKVLAAGTTFSLAVSPKGTEVSVEKGWARVTRAGEPERRVDAGGRMFLFAPPATAAKR